jgi:hypothetical protein
MLPVSIFYDDLQSPTRRIVSHSSCLSLFKQPSCLTLRAHSRLPDAISQDMLGHKNRV